MKRCLFVSALALMLSIFSLSYALTVQIGDGTATSGYFPYSGLYGYNYTQQIYTRAQINTAGAISKIRFYYVAGNISGGKDWTIYMGHTQKTSFASNTDWEAFANLTQVFSGDVSSMLPLGGHWMEITLDLPFHYNNTQNLLIAVHEYTPSYTSISWGAFTSGPNTGIYYRNDNAVNNPNPASPPTAGGRSGSINRIQLVFPDTEPPLPPVLISPADGGHTFAGQPLSWSLPAGNADATGYDVYIDGTPVSSNQAQNYFILPELSLGVHSWYVVARNAIGTSPASEVRTFEVLNGVYIGSTTSTQRHPFNCYYGYGRSVGHYTATQIGRVGLITDLGWSVSSPGSAAIPYKVYIKTVDADVDAQTVMTWDAFTASATLVKEGTHVFDSMGWHTLALDTPYVYEGGNLLIGVEANYGGGGAGYSNSPSFHYFTSTTGAHQYWQQDNNTPSGNGILNRNLPSLVMMLANLSTDPVFSLNLTQWDFGRLQINTSASQTFTITNAGGGSLTITGISPSSDGFFSVTDVPDFPIHLLTGDTATFDIQYAPTAVGNHTATFTITDGCCTNEITVSGKGFDPTITTFPHLENFDGTWIGDPAAPENWTVVNANNDSYTWSQGSSFISPTPSAPYAAYGAGNRDDWLITPPINLSSGIGMKWWDRVESANYPVSYKVMLSTTTPDIASFTTVLADITCTNTVWTEHTINISAYTGQTVYLAFYQYASASNYFGFGIDDFSLEEIPVTSALLITPEAIDFGTLFHDTLSAEVLVTITNHGTGTINLSASDISIIGPNAAEFSFGSANLPASLAVYQSVTLPVTVQSTTNGPISATLRTVFGGVNYDVPLSANILPESLLYVGSGTSYNSNTNSPCVYGGYFNNGREQYIITAAELTALGASAGLIKTIGYNVHNPNTSANLPNFTISIGHTDATEFADNSFLTGLTEAYSIATYTPKTGWNFHTLSSPFYWDGVSNIVIQTSYDMLPSYVRNASTYYSSTAPASRTLYYRSDSTPWDTVATGSLSTARPNMMLQIEEPLAGAPAAPILLSPAADQTDLPVAGFELRWSADLHNGGVPDYYTVFMSTNPGNLFGEYFWETTDSSLNPVLADPHFSFAYSQRYYWTVQASNDHGYAAAEPARSLYTETDPSILTLPHVENFDAVTAPKFPRAWTAYQSNGTSSIYTSTSQSQTPDNSVYMYTRTSGEILRLITPPIGVPINTIKLSFWLRTNGTSNYSLKVGTVNATDDSGVFTQVAEVMPTAAAAWELHEITFATYTGTDDYICFQHGAASGYQAIYLDSICFDELPAVEVRAVDMLGPGLTKVGQRATYTLKVLNFGANPLANYTVNLKDSEGNLLGSTTVTRALAPGATADIAVYWTPVAVGTYQLYTEVMASGDADTGNNVTPAQQVTVFAASTEHLPVGDTEDPDSVSHIPFNSYYKGFVAETVYLASEIQAYDGNIQAIVYYSSFNAARSIPARIWMKNTDIAALNAGWPTFDGYTLVYSGDLDIPAGKHEIVIPLTTPFVYTGGNLSIRTTKTFESDWAAGKNWLVMTDTNYPNRTRYLQSDTANAVNYANPATGTLTDEVPLISFVLDAATLVTSVAAPAVGVGVSETEAILAWPAVPYAYSYDIYESSDPLNFGSEPSMTVYSNSAALPITSSKGFFKLVSKSYRNYGSRGLSMWERLRCK